MYTFQKGFCSILLGLVCCLMTAQEFPPIRNYQNTDYGADNQNWSVTQSDDKSIYIANNKGVLEFNGARWRLYNSPNETIVRSVKAVDNRIYSGSYMEFGYWQKDIFGNLRYTSLSKQIANELIEDEQFWDIISVGEFVLFQSLDRIYIYNSNENTFETIDSNTRITKMFKVDDRIYFHRADQGLFEIVNGKDTLLSDHRIVKDNIVINMFNYNDQYLVQTQEAGIYILNESTLKIWEIPAAEVISKASVYNSIQLKDGNFAFGTISNGLIHMTSDGTINYKIDKNNGLNNNTVLSLFEDVDGNIWLGLDNGIDCINMRSPIRIYDDINDNLGTVYTAAQRDNKLFLGTNQGLFYKSLNENKSFEFIEGTRGQVWNLATINGQLFCGHNSGTFIIEQGKAIKVADIQGTWNLRPIKDRNNLIIQGNYDGLSVLELKGDTWAFRNKIEGFDISSRYFEFLNDREILVSHEYKGVFKLELDSDFYKVLKVTKDSISKGLHSGLLNYNNSLIYSFKDGIYKYDSKQEVFKKDTLFNQLFDDGYVSGKLVLTSQPERLWAFSNQSLSYIEPGKLSSKPEISTIHLPSPMRRGVTGYENVIHLGSEEYLFGTSSGYLILSLDKLSKRPYQIKIDAIISSTIDNRVNELDRSNPIELINDYNNIEFRYSIPEFDKYVKTEYQYQLIGRYDEWSSWSSSSSILFSNLPFGDYTFNVRARAGNTISENVATYQFSIARPWHLSHLALTTYGIMILLFSLFMHGNYRRYYRKQQEKLIKEKQRQLDLKELENKQQLMSFKNESLEQDIESKNRELAVSTMSLIKKNEFLNTIKQELLKLEHNKNLRPVIKIIDKNLNNTDDWKLFEEAFNNADKDFLKKIKEKHPNLTPNDLRLCAYLRLNLSSKEIAPLLNISPRSVEVKRYRLRKKMNLPHESSLTNYILEI